MKKPRNRLIWALVVLLVLLVVLVVPWVINLNQKVVEKFEGHRWELPARVYARPMDLFAGMKLSASQFQFLLDSLHYIRVSDVEDVTAGSYFQQDGGYSLWTKSFHFPGERQASRRLNLSLKDGRLESITDTETKKSVPLFRMEPVRIANIYPKHNEDRVLLKLDDAPKMLQQTLLSIEDQDFYKHWGVQPKSILRAGLANMKAGRAVQGGSTLTQQLVKNFFLSNERKLRRKLNEAVMALLLERRYSKQEILEAYLNEVYMGQDGNRSIHGFGLAAQFYFKRDLRELSVDQFALLVGLVKGASYYEPRRHPERAKERRNVVLDALAAEDVLSIEETGKLKAEPLGVVQKSPSGITAYPAFLQLVRKQLRRDYKDEDLQNEGLVIFTTFDPMIQATIETQITRRLVAIEKDKALKENSLQTAFIIASVEQGEVLAATGGRDPRYAGFNRILDMQRPVGSVIKPAIYLTALAEPVNFNLLTLLDDSELLIPLSTGDWEPQNYDREYHGDVTLLNALVHSYNVPTVRLGMQIGVPQVLATLKQLGIERPLNPFPSLLLGAAELTPIDVLQMYQTIAAGGYRTPLRSILAVNDSRGETLQRYPLEVEQAVPANADFLLTSILHEVTVNGTARALQYLLPPELSVAGKTGTTNDLRDSWFAGFSGEHVGIAWVGRDDNQPTGLTGSSGALRLWASVFSKLQTRSLQPLHPDDVEWALADPDFGVLTDGSCGGSWIPFIQDSPRPEMIDCDILMTQREVEYSADEVIAPVPDARGFDKLRGLFEDLF